MASITAVELGADTCALARTSVRRSGEIRLLGVETLDPAAFPGIESFTLALRQARRALKLPRRARVVLWGLPEGSTRTDAYVKPLLAPLTKAGFKVDRVVTPCNALAALARVRAPRTAGSTCWLAVNRAGVAIVVVRPGKQLYAHSFGWDSTVGASGSQARLLQRYSLVAYLSPQVKRAMAEAQKQGSPVDVVVTCGNLPDLRSLTMPLIEELDVEVETLDSLDGLTVKAPAPEGLAEAAAAIRLACAGALARGTRPWDESKRRAAHLVTGLVRAAAVLAGLAAVGIAWYAVQGRQTPLPLSKGAQPAAPRKTNTQPSAAGKAPATAATNAPKQSVSTAPPLPSKNPLPAQGTPAPPAASVVRPPTSTPAVVATSAKASQPSVSVAGPTQPAGRAAKPALPAPPVSAAPARPLAGSPATPGGRSQPPPAATARIQPAPQAVRPPIATPQPATTPAKPAQQPAATKGPPTGGPRPQPPVQPGSTPVTKVPGAASKTPATGTQPAPPAIRRPAPDLQAPSGAPKTPAPAVNAPRPAEVRPTTPAVPGVIPPSSAADKPGAGPSRTGAAGAAPEPAGSNHPAEAAKPVERPLPPLLKDPMPRVTAILVANDRRFATVDNGQIIEIGDVLGRRIVIAIDERAVVLREPSGLQVRVGLGGRILGVERGR